MSKLNRKISMAPMMDCTDRHDRYFLRLISKNIFLYSEMIATGTIIHGDRKKVLEFNEFEKPVALQLGGSDKKELAVSCKIAEDYGYDEINLNLGCPSKKVQKNKFGACLIKEPDLVAECWLHCLGEILKQDSKVCYLFFHLLNNELPISLLLFLHQ